MRAHHRLVMATATAAALTGGLLTLTAAPATAADSTTVAKADFNGDGIGDLATSASAAYVGGKKGAGQVVVLYGTRTGVTGSKRTTITQDTPGVPGGAEAGDAFGGALAYGDFNGDGYDDLAVGITHEKVGDDVNGGAVALLWGSKSGLTGKGADLPDPAVGSHDFWGHNLAAGDFDGDGRTDLVVGASGSTLYLYKGGFSSAGTAASRTTVKPPIQGGTGEDPLAPLNLTAGDVNGDGRTDLVVDGYETKTRYGWNTNYWLPGTANGLSTAAAKKLRAGIITGIGDINGDGYGDIVSGAFWDSGKVDDGTPLPDASTGGRVNITYGSVSGPDRNAAIDQNTGNVPGASEKGDAFGGELDLGDINGDGYQDLVISSIFEDLGNASDAGLVTVLYGSASGVNTATKAQSIAQSTAGVPGNDEKGDHFGMDVKLDDVTGDGRADLLVGSDEDGGDGALVYLPSDGTKITATGSRFVGVKNVGVSATGTPWFGSIIAN
ncbi:FG-GAP repeat domain-containing protein [Streptomyces sp. NBC_01601]|uniref:FG-GAP repeat domain-containing protein n=1 Tax=Streptomyces sp. NBC_01601 TaxID=2975892 RepID=UPI002E27AB4E|nr:VCBS repeat-containing protein [Streptomyces sp. NBC_01601]